MALISSKMLTEFASPTETSEMLMSFMKGVLGEHIGESEDVRKIVLATVTAWKDSSTQRYLKGIVDTINAIHKDERDGENRRSPAPAPRERTPGRGNYVGTPRRRPEPRVDALMHSESMRQRMNQ
jgi:plasmid stabilization system protein ParE